MDFYFIIQDLQKETKKNIFPPTKLSEKKLRVNLEILAFVALKRMGAENIKNHIRATSEPRDGCQFAAAKMTIFPSFSVS